MNALICRHDGARILHSRPGEHSARVSADAPIKLYWSATGAIVAAKDQPIAGADGWITLDPYTADVPAAVATRFKYVGNGGAFSVRTADAPRLKKLLTRQVVLAQENAARATQNASTAQLAGALDELYAPAASTAPLGASVAHGRTTFRLWAPTALAVSLYAYPGATAPAKLALPNGLFYDPNAQGGGHSAGDLMWLGDVIKASLAGSIRGYSLTTSWDAQLPLEQISFEGQPAGDVTNPSEVVNYVENHDNLTIFDNNAYKLPTATSREDRARVQMLGAAINAFSQGVAYFHAGVDTLRSKSLDSNSDDSGDWFNRLDWRYAGDNFGVGLPPAASNQSNWPLQQPLLANEAIKPTAVEIAWARTWVVEIDRTAQAYTHDQRLVGGPVWLPPTSARLPQLLG